MVELETRRLRLRPITIEAVPTLAQLWSDPEVMRYLPTGEPRPPAASQVEGTYMARHWEQHGFGVWTITLKGTEECIGYCGPQYLHPEPGGVAEENLLKSTDVELVAGLSRAYWRQGFVTEATEASLRYAFETLQLPRIVAAIHPQNAIAHHILEKLGLRLSAGIRYYHPACPHFVIWRADFVPGHTFCLLHHT